MLSCNRANNFVPDTTQIDQPDTPAPVFAARAFKAALFGSPSRRHPTSNARHSRRQPLIERDAGTPSKPPGILLTPGTGTTRRKRVSFGHELAATKIAEANGTTENSDDEWEESEDSEASTHDVTIDLNEPHSNSGRYWKEEYYKYHEGAKAEMEKLLKYKQLAKSFASQRDAQVTRLSERLKEEQEKVAKLEQMLAGNSQAATEAENEDKSVQNSALTEKLEKQTATSKQYRDRIEELEEEIDALVAERDTAKERKTVTESPGSQKALLEVQRELRKARNQVKEMGGLREQLATLKAQLQLAKSANSHREEPIEAPRNKELRSQVKALQHECEDKDEEMLRMKLEFEAFKMETEGRDGEMRNILQRAQSKISSLKKENKTLKSAAANAEKARPKSWHPHPDDMGLTDEIFPEPSRRRHSADMEDKPAKSPKSKSLREKYRDHDPDAERRESKSSRRAELEDADDRKQAFGTPRRSSREERAYLEDISTTPATEPRMTAADILASVRSKVRQQRGAAADDDSIDLLQHRFAKLGGPEISKRSSSARNTLSRSAAPPERQAAVMSRIDKRMAEKQKLRAKYLSGKENLRP